LDETDEMNTMLYVTMKDKDAITRRYNATRRDWASFLKDRSLHEIAEVIERDDGDLDLPDDFTPWAPGVVIPSDHLLRQIGPHSRDWESTHPDVYRKILHGNKLLVRGCGKLWTVERQIDTVLAYRFGPLPVFTRTPEAAMRLAEYCHLPATQDEPYHASPRGVASCFRWVVSTPDGIRWC
jgi:hypothetical protein